MGGFGEVYILPIDDVFCFMRFLEVMNGYRTAFFPDSILGGGSIRFEK